MACLGVPARAADDRDRTGGIGNQAKQRLHRIGTGGLGDMVDIGARFERG
jgi:hypothetical protein